jgi:hypothetical protein
MNCRTIATGLVIVSAGALCATSAHAGGIAVPVPPPPMIIAEPPRVVVVPGSPVYYAPGVDFNLFVYHRHYYRFHEGAWFIAPAHGGPWKHMVQARVPAPVLAVPVAYYRIPPGHVKKMGGTHFEHRGKSKHGGGGR